MTQEARAKPRPDPKSSEQPPGVPWGAMAPQDPYQLPQWAARTLEVGPEDRIHTR